jgi:hypothetical protein
MTMVTQMQCLICDPRFTVYYEDYKTSGSVSDEPADAADNIFQVWDCEGNVVTQSLPWFDCMWIAHALNQQADREQ